MSMGTMSAAANPELANRIIREAVDKPAQEAALAQIKPPETTVFRLCGGYLGPDGKTWETEFEVRELTGRDEEYLGKIGNGSLRVFTAILERGLVRVGSQRGGAQLLDSLLAGDWETVLLAVRAVTFGRAVVLKTTCQSCEQSYSVDIDLIDQVGRAECGKEDLTFQVIGRHGTVYNVCLPYGSTQRRMMERENLTNGEANTILLADCILDINGVPPLGTESVLNLPLADRREIVREIDARKIGPDLRGVRTKCPYCDAEMDSPLSIAALFQI